MIKFILTQGIGFSPGSIKYMPTLGFSSSSVVVPVLTTFMGYLEAQGPEA